MNSPALILLAYISEFCRRINKFTCESIMHDFIFIISTREDPWLPAFHRVHREAGSLLKSGIHRVCSVPNHNCLFSQIQHYKMFCCEDL